MPFDDIGANLRRQADPAGSGVLTVIEIRYR